MIDNDIQDRVQKRVKAKKGFLIHLGVYLATGIFFFILNVATMGSGEDWWFFFPMIPWALGLMIHYIAAFGFPGSQDLVKRWEIEETARELKKMREAQGKALPPEELGEDDLELKDLEKEREARYDDRDFV